MALIDSFQKSGNFLFKYRGQVPLFLFLVGIPFLLFSNSRIYYIMAECPTFAAHFGLIITIVAVAVSLLGFAIRIYTIGTTPRGTSGRNRDKQVASQLNSTGIYSIVRHPLYLGNYLMWAGLLIFTQDIALFLIISLIYWLYYERIMWVEEQYIEGQFGEQFKSWSMRTPAFVPSWKNYKKTDISFSIKPALRREYSGLFAMSFTFTIVDYLTYLRLWWLQPTGTPFHWLRGSLFALIAATLILLILRTLKHHTHLLEQGERD
ncbi:MAG: DUF1295 domain-containing protein [Bacteroidales bacterium]|jgi:protein-S-isoprenylcysteine O-methyltransferase Ste14|nr:DUF1295 domain-containing protein [Bacteroidales bacterium]